MAGSHSTAASASTGEREGWVTPSLVLFCLGSAAVTVLAGLVQVSFGSYSMTIVEAWAAVFDPAVVFDPAAWNAFLLGGELPEMDRRSLIVWNIRLPRVFVAFVAGDF